MEDIETKGKHKDINLLDDFHSWLKGKHFHHCYPNEFKVIDYALDSCGLKLPHLSKKNPHENSHACEAASGFYSRYEEYLNKVILRREFWQKCREWKKEYGSGWKLLYRKGKEHGQYFSGEWTPLLVEKLDDPYDTGYAEGRNAVVLNRR